MKKIFFTVLATTFSLGAFALVGCELIVNPDLSTVDAGTDATCAICLDGQVEYDDAGDPVAIVPLDSGSDAAIASDAAPE